MIGYPYAILIADQSHGKVQMTDTYSRVKNNLVTILQNVDHRVVALSGKWGTGKTYLWQAVKSELFGTKNKSEQPVYVSTFGAKTNNDLK
jgi:tRNA A37 threonylcarbamoyladenosine biosynthesis protein TsaE